MKATMRLMVAVLLLLAIDATLAEAQTVFFGPKRYTRTAGPPNQFTDTLTVPADATPPYTLHVVNGNADGTNRISSATVTVNGAQMLGPSDFGQNVAIIDRTVALQATNTLEIRLTSASGSFITVSVLDTSAGPQPTALTPNPLNLTTGATANLTATLAPAPTAAGTLAVSSANPVVATVPASVSFASGQTSVPLTVTAIASGSTTVTVMLNGGSAASQVTVTPPPPTSMSFTPMSGVVGTSVTITGTNFINVQTVTFNGVAAIFTINNATTLTAVVPPTATPGPIAVTTPGGTATSATPFTVLSPPALAPIGNKTVPLGSTLTFTATATDPDNDPLTFAVTPLPLPAHATLHAQTGQFIFTPDATQAGTVPLTISVTDGILTASETITVTVTGALPGGVTGVSGRVVDGSGQPIANLPVSLKGTAATATTNALGQFTLNNLTVNGKQVLLADGFALGYAILAAPVDLMPNVMNNLASELRVPALDMGSAVTVNPNATTVLGNPNFPAVSVTIPPHTAKNPDGTDFTGGLTISPVPEYGRPESRPVELKPGFSITIQPAGITLTTPAPITLPNTDNLPAGNELDLWSLSPDTGTFYVAGRMRVSADGTKLETISGGVRKTAWHFALSFAAQLINDLNRIIGGCTTCTISSGGDLTEGTLTQAVVIPGVRTLGVSRDFTLQYNSTTADVHPILPIAATLDVRAAVPQTFSADLTVGGLKQGTRGVWNASVMREDATSSTRMGVSYDGAALPTGRYPYELVTYSNYAQSSIGAITRGFTVVRNEQPSAVGAGWTLRGLDRLVPTTGDTLLVAGGDGRTIPFVAASLTHLVSWWPADGSAQDLRDGNAGALLNGTGFTAGQVGQAFLFDGIDDVVQVPHNVNLDPTGSFTVDAWIQTTINPLKPQLIVRKFECGQSCPATATALYQLTVTTTGTLAATVREAGATAGAAGQTLSGTRVVADGAFHHVALVRDVAGQELRLYIDGQLEVAAALSTEADGPLVDGDGEPDPLTIGAGVVGGQPTKDFFFRGVIDELEFFTRALPAAELNALYTAGGRRDATAEFLAPPGEYSTLTRNADGTYTRTLKDGTVYRFNVQGYQTAMADRNGNTTTYAYNGSHQLTTITDPAGQVTTLAYNGTRLATITDPAGRVTTFTHDSAGNLITVDAPDQTRTTFNYDAQHRMVQKRDARGQVYAYQFDFAGRLKKAVLPNGDNREIRPTELTGVPDLANGSGVPGNPATIQQPPVIQATFTDAKGQTTTFETDAIGRVTKQIDPLTRTTLIERDPQGNPTTITRPNGAITTMTYDARGNLLTSTEPVINATTRFLYEPIFHQVTRITDPKGNQTNITYDAKGNPLTITDADNKITRFFYNAQGLLTETRDALYPANPSTTFTYDTLGRLLTTTDPLNRTTTLTYDSAGNVATSKDALNRITIFQYDAKNRLTQVTDPLNGVTQYTYDGNGNLLTVKDAKNHVTTFAYDSRNRLVSTTDPLGKLETYEYDGNDNLTKRRTPKGEDILFAYNTVNELLSKTLPGNQVTSYLYDLVGNLTTVTDPDSVLTMAYDQANRLTSVKTDGSSHQPAVTLSYGYDQTGNRVSRLDPIQLANFTYDGLNRLRSLTAPPGPSSTTSGLLAAWLGEGTADDAINSQHGTLQNGLAFATGQLGQAFAFDGLDDYVTIPDSALLDNLGSAAALELWVKPILNPAAPQPTFRWLFARRNPNLLESFSVGLTETGRLVVVVQGTGPSSSFWSPVGTVQSNQWQHLAVTVDLTAGTVQAYVNGLPVSLTVVNGTGTITGTFANVTEGYLGRWQDPSVPASGVGPAYYKGLLDDVRLYTRVLMPTEVAAHAGQPSFITMAYDALSRRTAMTLPNGTQTTYTYDPASQVTTIVHKLGATGPTINEAAYTYNGIGNRNSLTDRRGVQNFGYDNLDRLTSASHPLLGTPQSFAYDPVGNRTTTGNVVNAGNQLTADATHSYQYDDNGNLTRKTLLATGNYTQYTYDAENRLIKVEDFVAGNPIAAFTSTYRYDGLGRRIEKIANGQTRRYVYDGEDILLEYDGNNVLQARYTHGPGIDEPIAVTKGSSTYFYHQDGLGSVTDLTDSVGATAKSYSYDAYGNVLESPGTVDQPYTYTGREFDAESGLYYYRARHYDPTTGRFLQQDPGTAGINSARLPRHPLDLVSQYAYASDNPIQLIDPFGNEPQEPGGVGVEACKYYDDVARANGCKYHPYAREYCDEPSKNLCIRNLASAGTINVIRQELIIEDQKARIDRSTEACDRPGCATADAVTAYHKKVFAAHGIPEWCFPSWWLSARGTGDR